MMNIFEDLYITTNDFYSKDGKLIRTGVVYENSHYSLFDCGVITLQLYRDVNGKREYLYVSEEELNDYFV